MADTWLRLVPPGPDVVQAYRAWEMAGCPHEHISAPLDRSINASTAHQMQAFHYLNWDSQMTQFMELRNLLDDRNPFPDHISLQSLSLPFEGHLITKLKILMVQREHLLNFFLYLLQILSVYDDILLDIAEGHL